MGGALELDRVALGQEAALPRAATGIGLELELDLESIGSIIGSKLGPEVYTKISQKSN